MIKINDLDFRNSVGKPFMRQGVFSGNEVCGIDMYVEVYKKETTTIEALLAMDEVQVVDPFRQQTYSATISKKSWGNRNNESIFFYSFEIVEKDTPPVVDKIELNGREFEPAKYSESQGVSGDIARHIRLYLDEEEFDFINSMVKEDSFEFRRVDIDASAIRVRNSNFMWWSSHVDDEGKTIYKQQLEIVEIKEKVNGNNEFNSIAQMVAAILERINLEQARREKLIEVLVEKDSLDKTVQNLLYTNKMEDLVSDKRAQAIRRETTRVRDLDEYLDGKSDKS